MIKFEHLLPKINEHVNSSPAREICGLIIHREGMNVYFPCKNVSHQIDSFEISSADLVEAEEQGKIVCVVHSHINKNPKPSQADLVEIERNNLPYLIVNYPLNNYTYSEPTGYKAPYIGREFFHGVTDCYSLFQDYYERELGIKLRGYLERKDEWWKKGFDLIRENYKKEDLVEISIDEIKKHDVIFMQVVSPVINHCAIYLGDNIILHHMSKRLSTKDVYGGYWRKSTVMAVRHKSQF